VFISSEYNIILSRVSLNVFHRAPNKSYNSWLSLTLSHSLDKGRPDIPCFSLLGFISKCSIQAVCNILFLLWSFVNLPLKLDAYILSLYSKKKIEKICLTFIQDYLCMSAWLSPRLTHVVLLLGGGVVIMPAAPAPCAGGVELVPLHAFC
jgi:hypothetical protein